MILFKLGFTKWTIRNQAKKVKLDLENAAIARENWAKVLSQFILDVEKNYPKTEFHHRTARNSGHYSIQIESDTGRVFPNIKGVNITEGCANLVYSLHSNGQILVVAYPHGSDIANTDQKSFILDFFKAGKLNGLFGKLRIERHLDIFSLLSLVSMSEVVPNKKSAKFLEKLTRKTEKYKNVFEDRAEQRKNQILQNTNLAIGLSAGLIAGTLIPLVLELSKEAHQAHKPDWTLDLASYITIPGLIFFTFILIMVALFITKKSMNAR